jgi:hypothetical protein
MRAVLAAAAAKADQVFDPPRLAAATVHAERSWEAAGYDKSWSTSSISDMEALKDEPIVEHVAGILLDSNPSRTDDVLQLGARSRVDAF